MTQISPLAFVDSKAILGDNVTISPFAYVEEGVTIGDNCHIRAHASILKGSIIGDNCDIYEGAIVGALPQDFRWKGQDSNVIIGNNTKIREQVIINRSIYAGQATRIGDHTHIMAQTHIGHDSSIGNYVVIGNSVKIAGDCVIGNYCILSSHALVHERCEIGDWVLIKGGCRVNSNVPPYVVMAHNPISYSGVNAFVLRKGKFDEDIIENIAKAYRHIYQCNVTPEGAVIRIKEDIPEAKERDAILDFMRNHNNKIAGVIADHLR